MTYGNSELRNDYVLIVNKDQAKNYGKRFLRRYFNYIDYSFTQVTYTTLSGM